MNRERPALIWVVLLAALLLPPAVAAVPPAAMGQETALSMGPGELVRLTVGPDSPSRSASHQAVRLTGMLVRTTSDSLILTDPSGGTRAVSIGEVRTLEGGRSRTRGEGATRGLKWGALLGGVGGGVLGAAAGASCDPDQAIVLCPGPWGGAAIMGLLFGGIGAGAGAVIGAVNPGERWIEIPLPETNVSLHFAGGGRGGIVTTWKF